MSIVREMTFVPHETVLGKINLLSYWIIFHSFVYYICGDNIVSDHQFDCIARQLLHMKETYPVEFEKCRYYDGIKGFEGSTGMGLYEASPDWLQLRIQKDYASYCDVYRNHKFPDGSSTRKS
jgi:hypothetical protein